MDKKVFHVIFNAHLDPVWLWDYREGLNEGIATCRSMLKFFREYPEFKFIRGESAIYEHLERFDPESFAEIGNLVKQGRWDIVGGNYVQMDTNITGTETFLKHFEYGKRYFQEKFGVDVQIAWAPDSFGHSAGLPDIYAASGLKYFAFARNMSNMPQLQRPVFRWRGQTGASLLTLFDNKSWYGTGRDEMTARLDDCLLKSATIPMCNLTVFAGLGDHGGGTSRRHLEEVFAWREKHPEVEVRISTLTDFFRAVEAEQLDWEEYTGELNFCLRGCHTSAARIKTKFRQCEGAVRRAELVTQSIAAATQTAAPSLDDEWKGEMFNSFHDILPGSSIDRAIAEQVEWMDQVIHNCRQKEFVALNQLAKKLTIKVKTPEYDMPEAVPFLIFNPRPVAFHGPVEVEFCMDYRPRFDCPNGVSDMPCEMLDEQGKAISWQNLATEHHSIHEWPWRRRIVAQLDVPPGGFRVVTLAHVKQPEPAPEIPCTLTNGKDFIANEFFKVEAKKGSSSLRITRTEDGTPVLACNGIKFITYEDIFGAWGSMNEDPKGWKGSKRVEVWKIQESKVIESGSECVRMFVHFAGSQSQIRLTISLYRNLDYVEVKTLTVWQDRAVRLRMVMDHADQVRYQVPGGEIERTVLGDVPGGRYLMLSGYGFASDGLCGFTNLEKSFGVNWIRGCRSASDEPGVDEAFHEREITDYGAHRMTFYITGDPAFAREMAGRLEMPLLQQMCYPQVGSGELSAPGSLFEVTPASVELWNFHTIQQIGDEPVNATVRLADGSEASYALAPWKLTRC